MAARAGLAFMLLVLAGLNALIAWSADTCTGNAPDSLFGFIITLPLNLAGMALLCWNPRTGPVVAAALVPAALAMPYTIGAISLAAGRTACNALTGSQDWGPSGDEPLLALAWGAAALIFWIGLAYALVGGYRPAHDPAADRFA